MRQVTIYTDGACKGNPGPGGYGVVLRCGKHRLELSRGYRRTTNNRMELLAAIRGLEALTEPCEVDLHSDSRYLIDALTKQWIRGWQKKGWRTASGESVKNQDLWLRLTEVASIHRVKWNWVKGHAGHAENECCDRLAVEAATGNRLEVDDGFAG